MVNSSILSAITRAERMVMGRKYIRELTTISLHLLISDNFGLDPPESILKESLKEYAQEGLSRVQKLA